MSKIHFQQPSVTDFVRVSKLKGVLPADLTCEGKTSVKRNIVLSRLLLMLTLVFNFNYVPV